MEIAGMIYMAADLNQYKFHQHTQVRLLEK